MELMGKIKRTHGALSYQLYSLKDHYEKTQHKKVVEYLTQLELDIKALLADETHEPYETVVAEQIRSEAFE